MSKELTDEQILTAFITTHTNTKTPEWVTEYVNFLRAKLAEAEEIFEEGKEVLLSKNRELADEALHAHLKNAELKRRVEELENNRRLHKINQAGGER